MNTKDYNIKLDGVEAFDLSLVVLRDLVDVLIEGAQRSGRLMAEGRSVCRGTPPGWLLAIGDLRVRSYEAGCLDFGVKAPTLHAAAPGRFSQQTLFGDRIDPDSTSFDFFLDAAADAVANRRDSERLDAGVLEALSRADSLFQKGVTKVQLGRAKGPAKGPAVVLDETAMQTIHTLAKETPSSRIARVRGVLDTVTASTTTFALKMADGEILRGFAPEPVFSELSALFNQDIVVEGLVAFRPSGRAIRIEAESVARATDADVLWAKSPRAEPSSTKPRYSAPGAELDALFGAWPGDETDEELAAALAEMS